MRGNDPEINRNGRRIMFEKFFPDRYVASTYVIDFEKLYKNGIRGLIFDIDNTLVPHGAPADERAIRLFQTSERNRVFLLSDFQ